MAHIVINYQTHAYSTLSFLDMFECAAAAGNVGHSCSLRISGAGITALSLQPERFTDRVHHKNTGKMLKSLPLYDVDEILILSHDPHVSLLENHHIADKVITWVDAFPPLATNDIIIDL